jgi:hypothetical protein
MRTFQVAGGTISEEFHLGECGESIRINTNDAPIMAQEKKTHLTARHLMFANLASWNTLTYGRRVVRRWEALNRLDLISMSKKFVWCLAGAVFVVFLMVHIYLHQGSFRNGTGWEILEVVRAAFNGIISGLAGLGAVMTVVSFYWIYETNTAVKKFGKKSRYHEVSWEIDKCTTSTWTIDSADFLRLLSKLNRINSQFKAQKDKGEVLSDEDEELFASLNSCLQFLADLKADNPIAQVSSSREFLERLIMVQTILMDKVVGGDQ